LLKNINSAPALRTKDPLHERLTIMSDESNQPQAPKDADPNLEGPEDTHNIKMTGQGEPGSHSAVFGLTPDGKKHDDTSHSSTITKPAHSKESAVGGGTVPDKAEDSSNTSSSAVAGSGVADQMHDPRVADKGHDGKAVESEAGAGDKPGAGTGGPEQGSGNVGEQGSGIMGKVKSYVSGS
jgi:hypothetical protein